MRRILFQVPDIPGRVVLSSRRDRELHLLPMCPHAKWELELGNMSTVLNARQQQRRPAGNHLGTRPTPKLLIRGTTETPPHLNYLLLIFPLF
jgi:hypothetical protein